MLSTIDQLIKKIRHSLYRFFQMPQERMIMVKLELFRDFSSDELKRESIFHAICWVSHKSKRLVKIVPSAEILVASEGINEK